MNHILVRPLALLALVSSIPVLGQDPDIPLQNWPAPLYWQAPPKEVAEDPFGKNAGNEERSAAITAPMIFVGVTPCRVLDTRGPAGPFGGPIMAGQETRSFLMPASPCGIPATANAFSLNVTVVPSGSLNWLTIWPTGSSTPLVSTLNALSGQIVANAAIVPAGPGGSINVFVTNPTHVIIDINGYYLPPSALALGAGTAAAPSLTFTNDANSGLYSSAAGTVSVAAAGTNRLNVNSTGIDVNGSINLTGALNLQGATLLRANQNSTGLGIGALNVLSTNNTGLGAFALGDVTTSPNNTAAGAGALRSLTTGVGSNDAFGAFALNSTTTGNRNTAVGSEALRLNQTGINNVAVGSTALYGTTGSNNIGLGMNAGANVLTGNFNIMIGNPALTTDTGTIRIGSGGNQTRAFIAGIRGSTTGTADAIPVLIDSNGQLGTASSSRRVKTDIREMGDTTGTLMSLRPVRFRYKVHGANAREQYGLIAEEVAEVAPDLAVQTPDGTVETVYYDKINAMLLNEVQKQHRLIEEQRQQVESLTRRLAELESAAKAVQPQP
jgi:hypothetical protein